MQALSEKLPFLNQAQSQTYCVIGEAEAGACGNLLDEYIDSESDKDEVGLIDMFFRHCFMSTQMELDMLLCSYNCSL